MATDQLARAVPTEVRDFADRSVEQAKRAFGGFIGAVTEAMQGEAAQPAAAPASSLKLSRLAVAFAQRNVQGAFDLARDMVNAKDLSQVLELQRQFLETQMRALKKQMQTLGQAPAAEGAKAAERKANEAV
jgi:hypothetical protein